MQANKLHVYARVITAVIAIGLLSYFIAPGDEVYIFKNLHGPTEKSVIIEEKETPWSQYGGGSTSRLAILLTDQDSGWLALAHGLRSVGIPFKITTDYKEAIQHKVVMVYPVFSGTALNREAMQGLASVPRRGDTLIAFNVLGGGLNSLFGFSEAVPSRTHLSLRYNNLPSDADPYEKTIVLNKSGATHPMGTYA